MEKHACSASGSAPSRISRASGFESDGLSRNSARRCEEVMGRTEATNVTRTQNFMMPFPALDHSHSVARPARLLPLRPKHSFLIAREIKAIDLPEWLVTSVLR